MVNPSPQYNFVNIKSAAERCLRLLGKTSADENLREHIEELLGLSAATSPKDTDPLYYVYYYRPYAVAALLLSQDLQANKLTEAEGVKFKETSGLIEAFFNSQRAIDTSQEWIIPKGFSIAELMNSVTTTSNNAPLNIYPSSVPYTVVF